MALCSKSGFLGALMVIAVLYTLVLVFFYSSLDIYMHDDDRYQQDFNVTPIALYRAVGSPSGHRGLYVGLVPRVSFYFAAGGGAGDCGQAGADG